MWLSCESFIKSIRLTSGDFSDRLNYFLAWIPILSQKLTTKIGLTHRRGINSSVAGTGIEKWHKSNRDLVAVEKGTNLYLQR
jgi:hypothetical protein